MKHRSIQRMTDTELFRHEQKLTKKQMEIEDELQKIDVQWRIRRSPDL